MQDYGFRLYNPAIGKFLSVDPLSPSYPELTPYQFSSNNPIRFIDLDGLESTSPPIFDKKGILVSPAIDNARAPEIIKATNEHTNKVVLVFFHGGPTGGGRDVTTGNDRGPTGQIFDATAEYARSLGREVVGIVVAPGVTQRSGINTADAFLDQNYQPGDQLIVAGYSYGGDLAVNLTERGREVDMLLIMDSSDGPMKQQTVDVTVDPNVKYTYNIYQKLAGGGFSKTGPDSDNPNSSEESTSDGGSNSMGSRGFPLSGHNVENYDGSGKDVTHGNIQNRHRDRIQGKLNERIKNYNTRSHNENGTVKTRESNKRRY